MSSEEDDAALSNAPSLSSPASPDTPLTNDESTWKDLTPATPEEQVSFDRSFVPMLSQSFIFERHGGATEVEIVEGETWTDNVVDDGRFHEDKTSTVALGWQERSQLRRYQAYFHDNPDSMLEYNFFANPNHDDFGPYSVFANALAKAALIYKTRVHIYPEGWWDEFTGN